MAVTVDRHQAGGRKSFLIMHKTTGFFCFCCRVLVYEAVEDFLFKFGMDGKACLLRAICETHESPLIGYGMFGEVMELFLT
jgi:hypothetical protein